MKVRSKESHLFELSINETISNFYSFDKDLKVIAYKDQSQRDRLMSESVSFVEKVNLPIIWGNCGWPQKEFLVESPHLF